METSVLKFFRDVLGTEPVPATEPVEVFEPSLREWDAVPIAACPCAARSILAAAQLLPYIKTCDVPQLAEQLIVSTTIAVDFDIWNRGEVPE